MSSIWLPYQSPSASHSMTIVRAEGSYIYTDDGTKYIDAIASWWVNTVGHTNPAVVQAITQQVQQVEQVLFANFTHPAANELVVMVSKLMPIPPAKIFLSDNGSTAVEVALKVLLQLNKSRNKTKFLALKGAYHGDTFGSMSVSERGTFNAPFDNHLFEVDFIDIYAENWSEQLNSLALDTYLGFIFEPLIQGAYGMKMYDRDRINSLGNLLNKNGIPIIADEVFTGIYRTGTFVACEQLDFSIDIYCLSKGITGGFLPLGVTTFSAHIVQEFISNSTTELLLHGHSYTGNALSCAAAVATLHELSTPFFQNNIQNIVQKHAQWIPYFRIKYPHSIRQCGTILAIEINTTEKTHYQNKLASKVTPFFLEHGIFLRPLGNVIYLVPPYTTTTDDLDQVYSAIELFCETLFFKN